MFYSKKNCAYSSQDIFILTDSNEQAISIGNPILQYMYIGSSFTIKNGKLTVHVLVIRL